MKKIIVLILTFCMMGSVMLKNVNAEETKIDYPFGYESGDVFVSDTLLGQSTDANGNNLGFTSFAYNPVIKQYTYKTIAEGIIDKEWLMGTSVFWKNAEDCLNGDFVDLVTWKQIMYETLIMDWLTYQFESDEFKSEFQKESANYGWKITKYLLKKEDIQDAGDLGKMSGVDASKLLDNDFYEQNKTLGKISDFNDNVSDILTVAKTGKEFYQQYSKVLAAKSACMSRIEFLKKVKQVSNNEDLCKAIDVVIDKLNMSSLDLAFNESGYTMLKTVCREAWGLIIKGAKIPMLSEIKLGKAGLDWLFNTSSANTKRIELVILYIINADFTTAYQQIRDNYISSKTEDNALVFNNTFLDYVLWEAYASNTTKEYIAESLLEGAWNQVVNLFSNKNIQTYNDLKNMIDGDISVCKGWYNIVGKYYNTYNKILSENEYMAWYNDNIVHTTGVHFEHDEVEIGLKDNDAFFWENVTVTPEDATDGSVTYKSSDESIVSVKDKQTLSIEVHKVGTAIITVATNDGGYTDTLKINVVEGHGKDGFLLQDTMKSIASGTCGDHAYWELYDNGKLYIYGSGNMKDYSYYTHSHTSHSAYYYSPPWIEYSNEIEEVTIADGITSIGRTSFGECTSLKYVNISNSVTSIGAHAFDSCSSLEYIKIPSKVTTIEDEAFCGCSSLKSIMIPKGITSISSCLFYGCVNLQEVEMSDSVTSIGNSSFRECIALKKINLSTNITSIEGAAFYGCSALESIIIPDGVKSIASGTFENCTNLKNIKLSDNIVNIGTYAFNECSSLENINIPDGVTSIGAYAFKDCNSLVSIKIPKVIDRVEKGLFQNCTNLVDITLPDGLVEIEEVAFYGCTSLIDIEIPDSITNLGNGSFENCINLKSITVPDGVAILNNNVFKNCSNLVNVKLPNSLISIGSSAFEKCSLLENLEIPHDVKYIYESAFCECSSLKSVEIPDSVVYIDKYAFAYCSNLTNIIISKNVTNMRSNIFYKSNSVIASVYADSYALQYVINYGVNYKIIGNDEILIEPTAVVLNKMQTTIKIESTDILIATFTPGDITDKSIIWSSSNTSVATVSSDGVVKGISAGTATITAKTSNGKIATCVVTVENSITSVKLDKTTATIYKGKTLTLKASISPSDTTNDKTLKWTSSNTKVATVSDKGVVTAIKPGTATITAFTTKSDIKATCKVTVKSPITSVKLDKTSVTILKGKTLTLKSTINPTDTTDSKILKWTSSNTKVATVSSSGVIKGVNGGTAKITVKTSNGKTATCTVTVPYTITYQLNGGVNNKNNPSSYYGKTIKLSNPTRKGYTFQGWYSDSKYKTKVTSFSSGNKTLYAKWTAAKYGIKYNMNKGTNSKSNPTSYYITSNTITLKNPTRKGYTFAGWYSDSKFKTRVTKIAKGSTGNKSLYAKWSKVSVAKAKTSTLTNISGKKLKITYSATTGAKGYQIQYATNSKFSKATTKTVSGRSATYTLSKGKTYYVRVRAYKIDSTGSKVYGSWSSVKSKKITK